jgi:TonB family protein
VRRLAQPKGRRSAWQRGGWTATSCLFHVTLLGVLVLFRPAAETARTPLRVRLLAAPMPVGPVAAPTPPPAKSVPAVRRTVRRPASVRESPTQAVVSGEAVGEPTLPEPIQPQGAMPFAPAPAPEPSPARGVGEDGRARRPSEGEGAPSGGGNTHLSPGEEGALPAHEATDQPAGLFIVSGGGDGTGQAGFGTAAGHAAAGNGTGTERGGSGGGNGTAAGHAAGGLAGLGGRGGSGAGSGVANLLGTIRRQIEQAKVYPDRMRREGIQGTVELKFRIASDGSVEAIEVARSSGHRVLDEVSAQTIRRAGPYPFIAGWIRIPLEYRLDR